MSRRLSVWIGFLSVALTSVLALACSAASPAAAEFVLTPGHEADPWQGAPPAETVKITRVGEDGTRTPFATTAAPLDRFTIERSGVARYELDGVDASGESVVAARSLLVDQSSVLDVELPLFVARRNGFARPPGAFTAPGSTPAATLSAGRSLVIAGPAQSDGLVHTERYDFGAWAPVPRQVAVGCATPPCQFTTLAAVGASLVLAIGTDDAVWFDLSDGSSGQAPLPAGLESYAELAGGSAVTAPDGSVYVVGATRSTGETSAVLQIALDGTLSLLRLTAPRAGAAVTWLDGLVVVGGNPRASGAERWLTGSGAFTALDYPPDSTTGSALVPFDAHSVVRLGGFTGDGSAAAGERLAIDCQATCSATPHSAPIALDQATAVAIGDDAFVVAGRDADGQTRVVELVAGVAQPVELREPRWNATAFDVWSLGQLAVFGGTHEDGTPALTLELFVP